MERKEIREYASRVWCLLVGNRRCAFSKLKKDSGLNDSQFGAALGWLAYENKIDLQEVEDDETYISMCMNLYIG